VHTHISISTTITSPFTHLPHIIIIIIIIIIMGLMFVSGIYFNDDFGPVDYELGALIIKVRGNPFKLDAEIPPRSICKIVMGCCGGEYLRLSYPLDSEGNSISITSVSPVQKYVVRHCIGVNLPNPLPIEFIFMKRNTTIEYTYGSKIITVVENDSAPFSYLDVVGVDGGCGTTTTTISSSSSSSIDTPPPPTHHHNTDLSVKNPKRGVKGTIKIIRQTRYYLNERLPDGVKCACCELPDGTLWITFILKTKRGKAYGSHRVIGLPFPQQGCQICNAPIYTAKFCPFCNGTLRPKFGNIYAEVRLPTPSYYYYYYAHSFYKPKCMMMAGWSPLLRWLRHQRESSAVQKNLQPTIKTRLKKVFSAL